MSNPEVPVDRTDGRTGAEPVVAVFDFDKTLSTRDNVLPFLAACVGRPVLLRTLIASSPSVLHGRRDLVKARLARLLTGRDEQEIGHVATRFADDVVARHVRPDVAARARWHGAQGHRVVIVSASFSVYLEPIAPRLGVDAVLATELEVADGRLTGRLMGANVRRAEKVRRLEEWLDGAPARIWAYGDSNGDRELLARADVGVRVGRAPIPAVPDDPLRNRSGPDSASGTERVAP